MWQVAGNAFLLTAEFFREDCKKAGRPKFKFHKFVLFDTMYLCQGVSATYIHTCSGGETK